MNNSRYSTYLFLENVVCLYLGNVACRIFLYIKKDFDPTLSVKDWRNLSAKMSSLTPCCISMWLQLKLLTLQGQVVTWVPFEKNLLPCSWVFEGNGKVVYRDWAQFCLVTAIYFGIFTTHPFFKNVGFWCGLGSIFFGAQSFASPLLWAFPCENGLTPLVFFFGPNNSILVIFMVIAELFLSLLTCL